MAKETMFNALKLIQNMAEDRSGKCLSENEKDWCRVFQIAHQASSRKCRKNHPDWSRHLVKWDGH